MKTLTGYYRHFSPIKQVVLDRDSHRCRRCGSTEHLLIHHNDERGWGYYRGSYSVKTPIDNGYSNLITLCPSCHQKLHSRKFSKTKDVEQIMQLRRSGKTFQAIGDMLGVSRQRVHQVVSEETVWFWTEKA